MNREERSIKAENKKWIADHKKRSVKKKHKKSISCPDYLKSKPYSEFLKSSYWNRVRNRVLTRDDHKCIICGSKDSLEVHHNTYKHHFAEYKHLDDLMTLCRNCHNVHHEAQD